MRREDDLPLPLDLSAISFADDRAAAAILLQLRTSSDADSRAGRYEPHLLHALSEAANPDQVLLTFERFVQGEADRPALLSYLALQPRAVEVLVRIFSGSQFLTTILLRHPEYLERLTRHRQMADLKGREEFLAEARDAMTVTGGDATARLNSLRRYQRWELLRIGTCDFTGLLDLRRVIVQLSLLADAIVQACLEIASEQEQDESLFSAPPPHPRPLSPEGERGDSFAVIALGKLGGEELNYSSDIDLLFIAEQVTPRHLRIARRLVQALANVTDEGFLYRVDMRLRPWGQAGELVSSHDSYLDYLRDHARLWEKQSLLKARVIAGNAELGWRFIASVQNDLFCSEADAVRASVRDAKQQIESELIRKHRDAADVKLGRGSIRDIEFVVQSLQLIHGGARANVRSFNSLDALIRLVESGLLPADDFQTLTAGYIFLRTVEHALQLVHHHQTHSVPESQPERLYLARRLDFPDETHLLTHLNRHRSAIRAVFDRHLNPREGVAISPADPQPPTVRDHVSRLEPSYAATFTVRDIIRHAELAGRIHGDNVVVVDAVPDDDDAWRVTIVGYDFTGELSIICGLLLLHGFNILEGDVFTYDAAGPKKIVDVFRVRPTVGPIERSETATSRSPAAARQESQSSPDAHISPTTELPTTFGSPVAERQGYFRGVWDAYASELSDLLRRLHAGEPARRVQADLARKIARALSRRPGAIPPLYPIDLQLDNESSDRFTLVRVRALDTAGFLYELTNSLALCGVDVSRVHVASHGPNVDDTFFITDADGRKLADLTKQRELRAAVVLIKSFTHLLPHAPDPERALLHFRELVSDLFTRTEWPAEIASLERPEVLDGLARLLGMSDFLWNDLLRMQHANLFPLVRDVDALARPRSATELQQELGALLGLCESSPESSRRAGGVSPPVDPGAESNTTGGLTPPARLQVVGDGDDLH
ncbi:MAG: hypothetical protein HZA46_15550 [Planctomycetales bacterium]|nr:hypothetical protein [Planctomycetales bacterium]